MLVALKLFFANCILFLWDCCLDAWTVLELSPLLMPPLCMESIQYFQSEHKRSVWFAQFLEVYRVRL